MESNSLPGGMFSGMLGLEMQLQQPINLQIPSNTPPQQQLSHPNMLSFGQHDSDQLQSQQTVKHGYPYAQKSKQLSGASDEEEPVFNGEDAAGAGADAGDGSKKMSPWHRMKWTDSMVKLLITAVYLVGDEWGTEGGNDASGKKKPGGLMQKKGKWKSVSRAMMEKGHYVSPQQCEDKFNDLNKRYKRVNDILGKGIACKVVENQSLLDTMDLPSKLKEEARKLLNSKHLFFKEICAYHRCCGHDVGAHQSPDMVAEPPQVQQQHQYIRSSENLGRTETEVSKMVRGGSAEEVEDDYEDDDSEDEDDDSDADGGEGGFKGRIGHRQGHGHEDEDENNGRYLRKRPRARGFMAWSPTVQQLRSEVMNVIQDGARSPLEKKNWIDMRMLTLEEQQVRYQYQAFELEKQRLKWIKFSSKKEREMERAKLENERRKLENERMVLVLRQKEMELNELHRQ